ncbi:MAG: hypothetical protein M3R18_10285 [Pseudomonadota bacterium]|nr:hypothetical protein [Pseudomonadota bacterium]
MKAIAGFAAAAIVAAVVITASAAALGYSCATPSSGNTSAPVPIRYEEGRAIESVRKAVFRADLEFVQARPAQRSLDWRRNFLCEVKATDLALAGFALFLVLAFMFQGQWLWRILHATERSAHIANQALVAAQRAYVVFKEFNVNVTRVPPLDEISHCTIQPVWENSGTTPTRNGRTYVNWRYFPGSIPSDFDFADFDEMGNRILAYESYSALVMGPKSKSFSPAIAIDASTVRMVRELEGRVLIWGWAEYDDIFEDSTRHRTEFCYQMIVSGDPPNSHIGFSQYRRFNGADEDCERKPTALVRP